jgi:CRISPR/Cas system CSM-associated protein Csm3 (group 7 of RAMP superfamily)
MARKLTQRIKVKGVLITQSPIHVGGISLDPTIDLALAVDGQGRYYIPGTSLAGALRQWMSGNLGDAQTQSLWGYQEKDKGHASFISIEDAYFDRPGVEIRDGVGINRQSGAAADGKKFDRAVIPKGVRCSFAMSVEIAAEGDFSDALDDLLNTLCAGNIRLGAAKTRGLGRVKLEDCQKLAQTLNTKVGMLQALRETIDSSYQPYTPKPPRQTAQLQIAITWKPIGAVMVKDAIEGNAVDAIPLTSADGENLALVIPGSSIKGALRSQAERIVRTVMNTSVATDDKFLEQVKVPIVENLFGAAADQNRQKLGQGALFVDDCYSHNRMTNAAWQQVIQATRKDKNPNTQQSYNPEGELITALNKAGLPSVQQAVHVAIDRWTGGAAEHMLYSNLEPFGINWHQIELTVNLDRLAEMKLPAIALLLLVLRDLYRQKIPLGYGVNRGMGAIEIEKIHVRGQVLEDKLTGFDLSINSDGSFAGIDPELLKTIDSAWQEQLSLGREVENHE